MMLSKKQGTLPAVCAGKSMPLSEMEDEAFSSGMLGVGYAIEPSEGVFFSPVNGKIESIPASGHAYTLQSDKGLEILVHIGVDTVRLGGEGFEALVREGERIKMGDPIAKVDLDLIRSRGFSAKTAVLVTEADSIGHIEFRFGSVTGTRDTVMTFRIK